MYEFDKVFSATATQVEVRPELARDRDNRERKEKRRLMMSVCAPQRCSSKLSHS